MRSHCYGRAFRKAVIAAFQQVLIESAMICVRRLPRIFARNGAGFKTSHVDSPILNHWRFRLQSSYISGTLADSARLTLQILPQFVGQQSSEVAQ